MTNKFIANGEIITTDMSIEDIEFQVQDALDENTSGIVKFRILELSEKEVRMVYIRDFISATLINTSFQIRIWQLSLVWE